jgi:hypothetical protein
LVALDKQILEISRAVMSLFLLMLDHSPAKIMILGHWSSYAAFLVYI